MKYWRGYLVAAIAGACTWGLIEFSKAHSALVDMIYPYVTRMIQDYLAQWSAGAAFCVWQVVLMVLGVLVLATAVLMIIFKWNPIQWFGWVLAGASVIFLLHTGLYGLNEYAGPLAADIRLQNVEYKCDITELEEAAVFYRDKANELAEQVSRDAEGNVQFAEFSLLAQQAGEGFRKLSYEEYNAVFAGSTLPVKELGWSDLFTSRGVTGVTVALTGEAAVNPQVPQVGLPFAMCQQMAQRMAIANRADSKMAAFLACDANSSAEFRYSGYFVIYWHFYHTLSAIYETSGATDFAKLEAGMSSKLKQDMETYDSFFPQNADGFVDGEVCDLMGVWHVEKHVLPLQKEEEAPFDPKDETKVDLSGIVNAKG